MYVDILEILLWAIAYGTSGSNRTKGSLESYLTILERSKRNPCNTFHLLYELQEYPQGQALN
jgi:hypothetical protein